VTDHAISWRRRILDYDRAQRRPQRFLWIYAAWCVAFWLAVFFALLFDVLGADGREPQEQPIREFVYQTLRAHPLAMSTLVPLVLTIAWWRFVSPGARLRRTVT
jgi:hypothetical protein